MSSAIAPLHQPSMPSRSGSFPQVMMRVCVLVCLVASCRVGPDYIAPEPELPDAWHAQAIDGLAEGEASLSRWWEAFDDPVLDGLIQRAVNENNDLDAAMARIDRSMATLGIARGELVPDIDAAGNATRSRLSEGVTEFVPPPFSRTDNFYGVGVGGTWEIDMWGRVRRSIEGADAGLAASVEDYRDVLVILLAQVGFSYVEVRELQTRIGFLQQNITSQRETLQLTRDRYDAEIAPELDVRQAELNLANTESLLPSLRQLLARAVHRVSVLVGDSPGALYELLGTDAPLPSAPENVTVGLPADLLRQRPDIRRAERLIAASNADIGVATAALYPLFSLNGSFGLEAGSDLLDSSNRAWSLGPAFRWNLFDGGRVRNAIRAESAELEEALAAYEQTVLLALEDVENAMVGYVEERHRRDALMRSVTAAQRSVELVKSLYRSGLTDFQNVLDTERFLFQQQDQLAESEGQVVQNLIDLYRALGGGWNPQNEESKP